MKDLKSLALCWLMLCGAMFLSAQTPEWQWAVSAGGTAEDRGIATVVDDQGNQYVTGRFGETATFGPNTFTSNGNYDIFLAKLGPAGNWLWAIQAGGIGDDRGIAIALDNAGNIHLAGYFSDTVTFGTQSLTSSGYYDIFAAKLDSAGN